MRVPAEELRGRPCRPACAPTSSASTSDKDLVPAITYHPAIIHDAAGAVRVRAAASSSFAQKANDSPRVIEAFGMAMLRIPMIPAELPPQRREMVMLAGRGAYYQAARLAGRRANRHSRLLVQRYPDSPNVHYAYGVFLLGEDPDRAIEEFKKELKQSPGPSASMLQLAFEYLKRSDWEAARPLGAAGRRLNPRDFAARRALGQVLFETGDTAGAIQQFEIGRQAGARQPVAAIRAGPRLPEGRPAGGRRARADEFLRLERLVRRPETW